MAMMELTAVRRHGSGKEGARKLLSLGKIPGIMYGKGRESRSVEFDRRDLEKFLSVARRGTVIVRLNVQEDAETKEAYAVLKEIQTSVDLFIEEFVLGRGGSLGGVGAGPGGSGADVGVQPAPARVN